MKARVFLFSLIVTNPAFFTAAQENSNPVQIIEGSRRQMKELDTLRADYTVNTTFGPSNKNIRYKVTYIKSGDKYSMSEYGYDGDEQIEETRTVYDEINIKVFNYNYKENIKQGIVHPKDLNEILYLRNNICQLAGFQFINTSFEETLDKRIFKNMGTELINNRTCTKIVMISPYKPGQKAYTYLWVEIQDEKYYIIKEACLIEDDPNQLLFEKQFGYNYSDTYPLPRNIYYERFEIDDDGKRTPSYKLNVAVENMQVNVPVADSEFVYFFPEGTLVDTTTASINPEKITDPNWTNIVKTPKNVVESNLPPKYNRTEFPIGGGCGAIVIPVNIQGQEYLFVLDTGSSHTTFDASLRGILGKPKRTVKAGTLTNPMIVQTFESPTVRIGPFSLQKRSEIACLDLTMFSMIDGRKISGFLGMDFLKNCIIQIDFDKGLLTFFKHDEVDTSSFDQQFDFNYNSQGLPQIKGRILDEINIDFVIDGGNLSTGDLYHETFEKLIEKKDIQVSETLAATPSGSQKMRQMRIKSLKVGAFNYKDLIFEESNQSSLGLEFLSRHFVILDFPNKVMYLKKGEQFDKIDESGMSGLALLLISDKLTVHSVSRESAAEKAGILAGDIIHKIEGKEAGNYESGQIRQLLKSGHGRKITMTIERNGETKEITLTLEKKI